MGKIKEYYFEEINKLDSFVDEYEYFKYYESIESINKIKNDENYNDDLELPF